MSYPETPDGMQIALKGRFWGRTNLLVEQVLGEIDPAAPDIGSPIRNQFQKVSFTAADFKKRSTLNLRDEASKLGEKILKKRTCDRVSAIVLVINVSEDSQNAQPIKVTERDFGWAGTRPTATIETEQPL